MPMECIKSVLLGLSSKPVPPLPKGVKVDLSRVIGALIECIEGVLAGSTEPWRFGMPVSSLPLLRSWTPPPEGERKEPLRMYHPPQRYVTAKKYVFVYIHIYHSLAKKGLWAVHMTLCSDICNIAAFYHGKAPMFTLSVSASLKHKWTMC